MIHVSLKNMFYDFYIQDSMNEKKGSYIYPKYSDISTNRQTCSKFFSHSII